MTETTNDAWWTSFNDTDLDALIRRIDAGNPSLRAAVGRYDQARALIRQDGAAAYPAVGAGASTTRSRAGGLISSSNSASLSISSWEIDLWGRVRRQVESDTATAQASAADLASTRLSLQAQLAQSYFQLRIADAQLRLLDESVAGYARSLELTRNRYAAGVAAKTDVAQAETQLASTQAQLIDTGITRKQLEHAIAILIGEPPASFSLAARDSLPTAQTLAQIPPALPSQLLRRRPDIVAAERRAAAANAQIGVATTAFYPSLTLSASAGYRSSTWADLLEAPSRVWSLGPALAYTVFDAGKRRAVQDGARAAFETSAANYRSTVLSAFQEVEDNLASIQALAEEAEVQRTAVRAARESLDSATNQYKAGTVSYLNVVTAQATLLSNQQSELTILKSRLNAQVVLIRAIGGGWVGG